jgi:hypothetical protein
MCGCTGGLLSGGPNTCHCSYCDFKSAATVAADELGHPADTSVEGSVTVAQHPCVHPTVVAMAGRRLFG